MKIKEWMFLVCTVLPKRKDTELGSRDQKASPSEAKDARVVSVPCRAWKCIPTAISITAISLQGDLFLLTVVFFLQ